MTKKLSERNKRVESQIHKNLSILIRDNIRDPRLAMLTISAVSVVRDYSHAKIYFRLLGEVDEKHILEAEAVINRAAGFLRYELGRTLHIHSIPQLQFLYDVSIDSGQHIEKIIEEALESDRDTTA
jgi:ribosome-binding factor A